jgi:hypothetical protein
MASFRAQVQKDGKVIFAGVVGDLHQDDRSWSGYFVVPGKVGVDAGDMCVLILDDGRSGTALIERVTYGSHKEAVAYFAGSGPLK